MRNVLTYSMIGIVAAVFLIASTVNNRGDAEAEPLIDERAQEALVFDEHCCTCDDCEQNGCDDEIEAVDRAEFEISRDRMTQEVELLWQMWFDDENASMTDPRRARFTEFAEYVADAVIMYQDTPTDVGGQLPGHKNDHLIMAYMIAKESSVTHDVVGTSNEEVGLMQLHGVSLAGYCDEKVQHNPKLGVLLGVRWLTSMLPKCASENSGVLGAEYDAWDDYDWVGPLSVYAGGPRGYGKNGKCLHFKTMRERVDTVRIYRTRIDHEMEYWED